jgi:putative membrane protein
MIGIGLVALVIATLEHRRDLNALKAEYPQVPRSLARILAGLVSILAILAFISALLRQ